jgi:hypothetical protein
MPDSSRSVRRQSDEVERLVARLGYRYARIRREAVVAAIRGE